MNVLYSHIQCLTNFYEDFESDILVLSCFTIALLLIFAACTSFVFIMFLSFKISQSLSYLTAMICSP